MVLHYNGILYDSEYYLLAGRIELFGSLLLLTDLKKGLLDIFRDGPGHPGLGLDLVVVPSLLVNILVLNMLTYIF